MGPNILLKGIVSLILRLSEFRRKVSLTSMCSIRMSSNLVIVLDFVQLRNLHKRKEEKKKVFFFLGGGGGWVTLFYKYGQRQTCRQGVDLRGW